MYIMKHLKKFNESLEEKKSELPTAEEIGNSLSMTDKQKQAMREYAKIHVEAALRAAADNYSEGPSDVVEQIIIDSYPLSNIK